MARKRPEQPVPPAQSGSRRRAGNRPAARAVGASRSGAAGARRHRRATLAGEEAYRLVVEDLTEVISRFKADGTFVFVNEVFCRLFGKTHRQLLGRKWQPSALAEDVPLIEEKLRTLSPANPVVVIENRVQAATGEVRWMQFVNRAFFDQAGRLVETQSVGRDITERRQAEAALGESRALQQAILNHLPDPVWLKELNGRFLAVNEAWCRFTGVRSDAVVGRMDAEVFRPEVVAGFREQERQVTACGDLLRFEEQLKDAQGLLRSLDTFRAPVADASGRVHATIGITRDITERKRAEDALRESQARLRSFYDSAPFMMGVVELEGDQIIGLEANSAVAAFFDTTPERLVECDGAEMNRSQVITSLWLEKYRQSQREQRAVRFEYQHPREAGFVWLSVSVATLPAAGAERPRFSFVAEDVTERKTAEDSLRQLNAALEQQVAERTGGLRESEARLRSQNAELERARNTLLEAQKIAHLGSFEYDAVTRKLAWSEEQYRIFGLDPAGAAPVYDQMLARLIHPEDRTHLDRTFREAVAGRQFYECEYRIVRPDGIVRHVHSRAQPSCNERGQLVRYVGTTLDITERELAEARLRQSEERRRLVMETMMHGVVHQRADGTIIAMNPAAERILGLTQQEFLGSSSVKQEHHTVREDGSPFPGLEHPAMVTLRTGKPVRSVVMGIWHPRRNERRWLEIDAVPMFTPGQVAPAEVYTVFADITERRLAELRMHTFSREVIAAREAERKQVSAALHHDAGSLAVGLSARLDQIERALGTGERQKAEDALAQTRKLLSQSLAHLKRLAVELRPPELDTLGLPAALQQHFTQCQQPGGIQIRFRDNWGRRPMAEAPASVLFRIAQEAVTNTLKHARAQRVDVRLWSVKGGVTLTLADDGCGFDPAGPSAQPGTAMGLRVMQEMAALANGQCRVESAPGQGTTVRVRLPLAEPHAPPAGSRKQPTRRKPDAASRAA